MPGQNAFSTSLLQPGLLHIRDVGQPPPHRLGSRRLAASSLLAVILILSGPITASSSVTPTTEQFLAKYVDLNLGNVGSSAFAFPDAPDAMNTFNRALVTSIPIGSTYPAGGDLAYRFELHYGSNYWQWSEQGGIVTAVPRQATWEAGAGWNLGFGRLLEPSSSGYGLWAYQAPDGKIIRLYTGSVANVYYSEDGTDLRLRVVPGQSATLEWPDGQRRSFGKVGGRWEVVELADVAGNHLALTYDYEQNRVDAVDGYGRTHTVFLVADPADPTRSLVDRVDLSGVGGSRSVFAFHYTLATVDRPPSDNDPATPPTATVSLLESISVGGADIGSFQYYSGSHLAAGRLQAQVTRFGGTIQYEYAQIELPYPPAIGNPTAATMDHFGALGIGLSRRTVIDSDNAELGSWSFSSSWLGGVRNPPPSAQQPLTLCTRISKPGGFTEFRYSSVPVFDLLLPNGATLARSEYGLPFAASAPWRRSIAHRRTSPSTPLEWTQGLYEISCNDCLDARADLSVKRRTFVGSADAPAQILTTSYFGRDWAGRPTQVVEEDSLGYAPTRTTTLSGGGSFPGPAAAWVAKPFASTVVAEASAQTTVLLCSDAAGHVTRRRELRGDNPGSTDFLSVMNYDAQGNLIRLDYYGGDAQPIAISGDACNLALPSQPAFRRFYEYSCGTPSASGFLNTDGSILAESYRKTIDPSTGLPVSRSKGDDLYQEISYDNQFRVTSQTIPAGAGAHLDISYAGAWGGARFSETRTLYDGSGSILAQRIRERDGFGRTTAERTRGASGWSADETTFDAEGRATSTTSSGGAVTEYLAMDYRGRPAIIRPPDGAGHDLTRRYTGEHHLVTVYSVSKDSGTTNGNEETREVHATLDRYGRKILETIEDSDGAERQTALVYNIDGTWVSRTQGSTVTVNLETYDRSGLLVQDSRGATYTYNALRQPLQRYSRYGQRVDLAYDGAGREITRSSGGKVYTQFFYATSGVGTKGKLTLARRYNWNVPDVPGGLIIVDDYFAYSGVGGRASARTTRLFNNAWTQLLDMTSAVAYDAAGDVLVLSGPGCVGSQYYTCQLAARQYSYTYQFGQLLSLTDSAGRSWLYDVTYEGGGRPGSYRFGNGLRTTLSYSPEVSGVNRVTVSNGSGAVIWSSQDASVDGTGETVAFGSNSNVPPDFNDLLEAQQQPTSFELFHTNSENRVDPYGLPVVRSVGCVPYPPCLNTFVYNAFNQKIWYRQRPLWWPTSPVGMETPSILTMYDVLDRESAISRGDSSYIKNGYTISLHASYGYDAGRQDNAFARGLRIGTGDWWGVATYYHSDLSGADFGSSTRSGTFVPREWF